MIDWRDRELRLRLLAAGAVFASVAFGRVALDTHFSSLPVPSKEGVLSNSPGADKRHQSDPPPSFRLPVPPRVDPATDRVEPPEAPRSRPKRALDVLSESPARSDQTETPSARVIQPLQRQRQPSTGLTAAEATPERTVDLPGSVSEPFEPPRNAQEERSAGDVLRRIEAGEGPGLEIAWPSDPASRLHLTRVLSRCHGMATILMGEEGGWNLEDAGSPWRFVPTVHSGFVRTVAETTLLPRDRASIARARRDAQFRTAPVRRVFPRHQDIALLSGLSRVIGEALSDQMSLRAAYEVGPLGVRIGNVTANGRSHQGGFTLPAERGCEP